MCQDHDEILFAFSASIGILDDRWLCAFWKPPPLNCVKLNTDGSYRDRTQVMGAGGLLHDHQGRWLAGFATHRPYGNALQAEALALHLGLQLAWSRGFREVLCEVDCKELITLLEDQSVRSFMPILEDIYQSIHRVWKVSLNHISREANAPADYLAKLGADCSSQDVLVFLVPNSEVAALVLKDSLRIP